MKFILIVALMVSSSFADLFLDRDTLIMSDRGVLVQLHILSTTSTTQKSIVKGYYGPIPGQALQNATDTIVVQKGLLSFPSVGFHEWHKFNDSIWQDYFYYSSTGVKYLGTFIKSELFCVYVNNSAERDSINAWSFFNTYLRLGSHIATIYRNRTYPTKIKIIYKTACLKSNKDKRMFLLNGRCSLGTNTHNRIITR